MKSFFFWRIGVATLAVSAGSVWAESAASADALGEPVQLTVLDDVRGMGGVLDITSVANLNATLSDNDASNSVTGNNSIDGNVFTEASGVFSIIQNTGNNVIIQDSTIITVTINPEL